MKNQTLIKITSTILSATMLFFFCGCNFLNKKNYTSNKTNEIPYSEIVSNLYSMRNFEVETTNIGAISKLTATSPTGQIIKHSFENNFISRVEYQNNNLNANEISINNQEKSAFNEYSYNDNGDLTTINSNGNLYAFEYDDHNNFVFGSLNGDIQYKNTHDELGNITKTEYANGDTIITLLIGKVLLCKP